MPRARSSAIQSEVTPRRPALPCTAPAWLIAEACKARASVRVDLPASGWLITANARRLAASASTREPAAFEPGTDALEPGTDALESGTAALESGTAAPAARGSAPVSAIVTYVR